MTTAKSTPWEKVSQVNRLNYSGQLFRVAAILLTHILVARSLNHSDLSDYSWVYGLCIFPQTLFSLGFEQAYSYFFPKLRSENENLRIGSLFRESFLLVLVISLLGFLIFSTLGYLLLVNLGEIRLLPLLVVTLFANSIFAIVQLPIGALRGIEYFKNSVISEQFLLPGLPFAFVVASCIFFPNPMTIIGAQGIGFLFTGVIAGMFLHKSFESEGALLGKKSKSQLPAKKWVYFSAPIALMLTMETIFNWTILSVSGPILSDFEVSFIGVAIRSIQMFTFLSMAIAPLIMPRFSQSFVLKKNDEIKEMIHNLTFWLWSWSLVIGFGVAVNRGLIMSVFGWDFFLAANLLLWLIPGGIIEGAGAYIKIISLSIGRNIYGFYVYLGGTVVTGISCYFLSDLYQGAGALAAGSIGFLFINITRMVVFFKANKTWPTTISNFQKIIANIVVLSGSFYLIESFFPMDSFIGRILTSASLATLCLAASFWKDRKILLNFK